MRTGRVARVPGIVVLLSKDFLRLVGIVFIVAEPIAYFWSSTIPKGVLRVAVLASLEVVRQT